MATERHLKDELLKSVLKTDTTFERNIVQINPQIEADHSLYLLYKCKTKLLFENHIMKYISLIFK